MFRQVNPNPRGLFAEDCVVRAIAIATNQSWDSAYWAICLEGGIIKNMPSVDSIWGSYLKRHGFVPHPLPTNCPNCYSVRDFCRENPTGIYILATSSHVIAVIDGDWCDTWDSGDEMPVTVWRRE